MKRNRRGNIKKKRGARRGIAWGNAKGRQWKAGDLDYFFCRFVTDKRFVLQLMENIV